MSRLLIPLSKALDDAPVVYVISGQAGHCASFKPLAKRLMADWRMVGLLHPRFVDPAQRFQSLEALSQTFGADIGRPKRALIFGYSLGGALGYDLAMLLHAQGVEVGLVVFDTQMRSLHRKRHPVRFKALDALRAVRDVVVPVVWPSYFRKKMHDWDAAKNMRRYRPEPSDIPIAVIMPGDPYAGAPFLPEPDLGWGKLGQVVRSSTCAGDHWTAFKPPHAVEFAEHVDAALSAVCAELARAATNTKTAPRGLAGGAAI